MWRRLFPLSSSHAVATSFRRDVSTRAVVAAPASVASSRHRHRHRRKAPDGIIMFGSLHEFMKQKVIIETSNMRIAMLDQGYRMIRPLGRGKFGRVFLVRKETTRELFAVKLVDVSEPRRDFHWTWLTAEERAQAEQDINLMGSMADRLEGGVVRDHMLEALDVLREKLRKEEDPKIRGTRRPVAEREILMRLDHPYLVKLHHTFQDHQNLYMVITYFPGGTLMDELVRRQRFDEATARVFAAEILLALEYMAGQNVAHRDLKPQNMLLTAEGHCVLCDFGLATRMRGGLKTFCGTAEYIAPEVLSQKTWKADNLDRWAYAVWLYQMLAGETPFVDEDAKAVFMNILMGRVTFPAHFSPEAKDILKKMLEPKIEDRLGIAEIKAHPFFDGVNWESVFNGAIRPDIEITDQTPRYLKQFLENSVIKDPPSVLPHLSSIADTMDSAGSRIGSASSLSGSKP